MLALGDFDGILSDLDGVLADSAAPIARIYDAWADRHGLDRDAVRRSYPGTPAEIVVAEVAPHLDPATESAALLEDELREGAAVRPLPGAAALLADPPAPLAVVTSCPRPLAEQRFTAMGVDPPGVVVTADDVGHGKPGPEPYVTGARLLGVDPARCLVIEDAPNGVTAGRAAGCTVLGLVTTHAAEELAGAHALAPDLAEALRGRTSAP